MSNSNGTLFFFGMKSAKLKKLIPAGGSVGDISFYSLSPNSILSGRIGDWDIEKEGEFKLYYNSSSKRWITVRCKYGQRKFWYGIVERAPEHGEEKELIFTDRGNLTFSEPETTAVKDNWSDKEFVCAFFYTHRESKFALEQE